MLILLSPFPGRIVIVQLVYKLFWCFWATLTRASLKVSRDQIDFQTIDDLISDGASPESFTWSDWLPNNRWPDQRWWESWKFHLIRLTSKQSMTWSAMVGVEPVDVCLVCDTLITNSISCDSSHGATPPPPALWPPHWHRLDVWGVPQTAPLAVGSRDAGLLGSWSPCHFETCFLPFTSWFQYPPLVCTWSSAVSVAMWHSVGVGGGGVDTIWSDPRETPGCFCPYRRRRLEETSIIYTFWTSTY